MEDITAEEQAYLDSRGAGEPAAPVAPAPAPAPAPEPTIEPAAPGAAEPAPVEPTPVDPAAVPAIAEPAAPEPARTVPLAEHLEERKKRQALEAEVKAEAEKRAKLEGRFDEIAKRFAVPEPAPAAEPDVELDPVAVVKDLQAWKQERVKQDAQAAVDQRRYQEFANAVVTDEQRFTATTPDYAAAVDFLKRSVVDELKALGWTDEAQIAQEVTNRSVQFAGHALRSGKSAAEAAYTISKQRGYVPPSAAPAPPPVAAAPAAPVAAAAVPIPAAPATEAAKLDAVIRGVGAAKSLGSAPGSAPPKIDLDALANLSEEEMGKFDNATWRKIMKAS